MDYDYTGQRVKKYGPLGLVLYPFPGYEIGPDGTKTKFFRAGTELLAAKQSPVSNPEKKLFYPPSQKAPDSSRGIDAKRVSVEAGSSVRRIAVFV